MLKLNILALLSNRSKTKYWLNKQLGMSYTNFNKMVNNQTKSIQYKHIEIMCELLDCSPNDLLILCPDEPEE